MKAIIPLCLAMFLLSCGKRSPASEAHVINSYCTPTESFSIADDRDSLRQLMCSLLSLYNEPCMFSHDNHTDMIRLIISIDNQYSYIFRISKTKSCNIITIKVVPPSLLSIFGFYTGNRMVSYKMYEFPIENFVFDSIKYEISNLKTVPEPDSTYSDLYKEYILEYYHNDRYVINDTSSVWKGMDMAPIEKILMEYMPKDDGEALYGRLRRRPGEF